MRFNSFLVEITALLAAAIPADAARASSSTFVDKKATSTVFIPPASTGKGALYASILTESASTTQYLLGCEANWSAPRSCNGDFKGVTLTKGPSMVYVALAGTTYDCTLNSNNAVCATKTASSGQPSTTTITETSKWMTPVTVVDTRVKVCRMTKRKNKPSTTSCSVRAINATVAEDSGDTDESAALALHRQNTTGIAAVAVALAAYVGTILLF
ncbi:hypothetical protein V2G26_007391 [Clonostachys chloroleuca]|uniref:Uncharacterized protein n=1 Tax=Clonostachys chloroleuca TaxID=1926264 RepID=A0AA35QDG3_9HYPO|nr:unnamed protein product [Clonostachys chloroleuca]